MPFEGNVSHRRSDRDRNAGLRESLLSLLSDPQSPVVPFPKQTPLKLRHVPVTAKDAALIPAPRDIRQRNAVRLVVDEKRQARSSLIMSLGGTVLGAIAIGALIGSAIAFDGVSVLESYILADVPPATSFDAASDDAPIYAGVIQSNSAFTAR